MGLWQSLRAQGQRVIVAGDLNISRRVQDTHWTRVLLPLSAVLVPGYATGEQGAPVLWIVPLCLLAIQPCRTHTNTHTHTRTHAHTHARTHAHTHARKQWFHAAETDMMLSQLRREWPGVQACLATRVVQEITVNAAAGKQQKWRCVVDTPQGRVVLGSPQETRQAAESAYDVRACVRCVLPSPSNSPVAPCLDDHAASVPLSDQAHRQALGSVCARR
jgi:hypothetical protein